MVRPHSNLRHRLLSFATTLLTLASWPAFADESDPEQPASAAAARAPTEAANPNAPPQSDKAQPSSPDSNKPDPTTNAEPSAPAPKPKPETPAERTAQLTKLFRYEINGDTRRLLDTTFAYPKDISQLEADYDKCLDEERYADGEKVATVLVNLLRERYPRQTEPNNTKSPSTDHVLLTMWVDESSLCKSAAGGKYGTGGSVRRGIGLARLKMVREISVDWTPGENDGVIKSDAVGHPNEATRGVYLLLRAVKIEERQPANLDDEITQTVNTVLDRVTVTPIILKQPWNHQVDLRSMKAASNVEWKSLKLRDLPEDVLLYIDLPSLPDAESHAITPLPVGVPIRRSQLGTHVAAQLAEQKRRDKETQDRVHSALLRLFPSETIEVHVIQGTPILRASLRDADHEQQIVAVTLVICERQVLNQMSVDGNGTDRETKSAEELKPFGDDPRGLREILARLYPKEHIEAHVLPAHSSVVLRGHLSRPEYAQQVFDIAGVSYQSVLYQMTPPLPTKPKSSTAAPGRTTTRQTTSSDGESNDQKSDRTTIVMRLQHVLAEEAAQELQPKFSGKATIIVDVQTNSLLMTAVPAVIKEFQDAVIVLNEKRAKKIASTAPTDVQEAAMDREARQLAMKIRTAKPDEQPGLRRQLEQLTERHFEQRQQRRQREIDDLAHRVDKLRVTHHRREENKAAVIQQRVQDLLDPNADLRWDEPRTNEVSKTDAFKGVGTVPQPDGVTHPSGDKTKVVGNAHPTDATGGKRLEPDAFELDNDGHTKRFMIFAVLPDRGFLDEPLDIRYRMAVPKGNDATDIVVEETIPDGTEFFGALPREAELKDGKLTWRFGDRKGGSETVFMMRIVPRKCLTLTSQIRATSSSLGEATNPHRNKTLVVEVATSSRSAEAQSANEPTFDGTSYSQWLKMLETERKPEKLAAAILACSRLVVKGDERRIVRGIFAAARLFDATESAKERSTVWNASYDALWRLLSEGVPDMGESTAEELLTHIGDARFAESPGFVMEFFSSLVRGKIKPSKALQAHAPAWVAALVRHDSVSAKFDPRLAVAASSLWMVSRTPIDDFEGLRPLVLKGYDAHVSGAHRSSTWSAIQTAEYATEVPEIVQILAKFIDKNPGDVVDVLGNLGPTAEPAVPQLVELFVKIWNQREERFREVAAGKAPYKSQGDHDFSAQRNLLATLKKIGPGAKQAVPLLKELNSIAPHEEKDPDKADFVGFWDELNKTLLAIGDTPDNEPAGSKPLLSEFSHLATTWRLAASRPGQTIPRITLHIGDDFRFGPQGAGPMFQVLELLGCRTSGPNYTIDETTNPKQITLVDRDVKTHQQFGIWELKGDRLKIEFAKPGLPRPKEFSSDRDKLPEGHILLEFERDRGEETP
ncbi:MAG: hypothetical protein H7062_03710 [Candidatus Saccharimonas sp.]|nr:hypothetical protein [Planctomycetaceae bacterium]